jgi:hypothetical protein
MRHCIPGPVAIEEPLEKRGHFLVAEATGRRPRIGQRTPAPPQHREIDFDLASHLTTVGQLERGSCVEMIEDDIQGEESLKAML